MGNNQYKAKTITGLDVGYSSTKGIGGDLAYCVPSIIKPIWDVRIVGELKDTDIILEDHKTNVHVQTGLPCEYIDRDRDEIAEQLLHQYDISIQVGNSKPR